MKIKGETPGRNRTRYLIRRPDGRGWVVWLQAHPYGFAERMEREIVEPEAPVEFAKGEGGRILRDEEDRALTYRNRSEPTYRARLNRVNQLRSIYALVEALRSDPDVQFDAKRESFPTPEAWLTAIETELADAGITDAEILRMLGKVSDLNQGMSDRVDKAVDDFLSRHPSPTDGGSPANPDGPNAT